MSEFATYAFLPSTIHGPPLELGTQVEIRIVATVKRASGWSDATLALRIDDWAGPTAYAKVVD